MKLIMKCLIILFVLGNVSCRDTKKDDKNNEAEAEIVETATTEAEASSPEIEQASQELDKEVNELEDALKELDSI